MCKDFFLYIASTDELKHVKLGSYAILYES